MADGVANGTPSPIRRLVDRFQNEQFCSSTTPSARGIARHPGSQMFWTACQVDEDTVCCRFSTAAR